MQYVKLTLFAFFLSIAGIVRAQEVLYSDYDKFDYRDDEYEVVGMSGGLMYAYENVSGTPELNAYDDSMNKVATVLLDFFPAKIYEVKFIAYPDKMIALYQALESNKVVQYAALLDDKGRLQGRPVMLGSVKTGILGATRTYFKSAVSEDKKMIFIYSADDRGSKTELEGRWLNDSLKIVKRSRAIYKADNRITHGEVNIANDGTIYEAAFTELGSHDYADEFWILSLPAGGTKFEPHELQLGGRYAASGYMKVDNLNDKIYFGGFYSDRKNGNFNGIIYAAYDIAGNTFQAMKFLPFDNNLAYAAGAGRRNPHPFDNYQVKQLIIKNDGGFVLIAEEQYITVRSTYTPDFYYYSYYSPYMTTSVREYHYNDIMSLSYNGDGTREWSAFIPKQQYSQEDGGVFSSYALLNTGGTLAFLYNNFNSRRTRIQLATLSPDGKTDVHSFTAEGSDYPDWIPRSGKQVAARQLVVPCFHKKEICFAKVMF